MIEKDFDKLEIDIPFYFVKVKMVSSKILNIGEAEGSREGR